MYSSLKALRPEKMPDGTVIGSKICWLAFCISIDVQMIYTLSVTRARDSVNSHVTQIHSRERCKPGQYAGWQLLQLVASKRKASVGRREETVSQTLAANAAPSRVGIDMKMQENM